MIDMVSDSEKIIFKPESGYEVKQAILEAIELADKNHKSVELTIEGIVLTVNRNSKVSTIVGKFFAKLERKHTAEILRYKQNQI